MRAGPYRTETAGQLMLESEDEPDVYPYLDGYREGPLWVGSLYAVGREDRVSPIGPAHSFLPSNPKAVCCLSLFDHSGYIRKKDLDNNPLPRLFYSSTSSFLFLLSALVTVQSDKKCSWIINLIKPLYRQTDEALDTLFK